MSSYLPPQTNSSARSTTKQADNLLDFGGVSKKKKGSLFDGGDDFMISLKSSTGSSTSKKYEEYDEDETEIKESSSLLGNSSDAVKPNLYQSKL